MLSKIILFASVFYLVSSRNIQDQGNHSVIEIPKECPAKGGCTIEPKGYEEIVAKIEKLLPEYFKQNYTDRDGEDKLEPPVKYSENDRNNCAYEVSTKLYTSYEGHYLAQINGFKQYVEEVKCLNDNILNGLAAGKECLNDVISMEFGRQSSCKTVYKKYTLYALNDDQTAIVPKVYDIPGCCSCAVTEF